MGENGRKTAADVGVLVQLYDMDQLTSWGRDHFDKIPKSQKCFAVAAGGEQDEKCAPSIL